ncbi:hypothetical protein FOCC_FOCC012976 [Frankliniella occidentalis]|uniref:Uncharacterized protein LOC127750542 n=1 Tax=Frankliniella occidentalis TaxID=133901 RepID=A0A9C6X3F5_FRAOC|nr:uncharacterized protein LOC127750542 [Frankliniella occidentalis]KAE8741491.1 hypothetical protein FOCC_FOCC012976 [Frankliniella occidentalis]
MSNNPPAKRLRSSGPLVNHRPPVECIEEGDSADEDDLEPDAGNDHESDFSDGELDVSYEPHVTTRSSSASDSAPGVSSSSGNVRTASKSCDVNTVAGNFVLSLHEKCFVSQSDRKEVLDDAKLLVKEGIKKFAEKVDSALKSQGSKVRLNDILNVEKYASSTCYDTFKNLETKSQQAKFFKDTIGVTDVKRIPLGKVLLRGRKGGVTKTKVIDQELIYVPLEETVDKMINHPDYKFFVENTQSGTCNSEYLDCYMKGSLAKENKILREHPDALRFILYYDDVEVLSPLKSRAGKQKVGAFYIFLDNIPLQYRSCLKVICLLGLVNANLIKGKYYGMDAALEAIVDILKKFEDGIQLPSGTKVYGTLIAVIGDNLGQHCMGGFKEGFTATRCCRICMARFESEIKTMTKEDEKLLRTKEDYRQQIDKIQTSRGKNEKFSTEYGLNRESCLNKLDTFHVLENFPYDGMHCLLEGALSLAVKKVLKHYLYDVKEKPFTLDWLNQAILSFDFDYSETRDKASELKEDFIKDDSVSLHQSAAQLWLLATILPLILSPLIDCEDVHWTNYLDMLEICRIVFTVKIPLWLVTYLQDLIDGYLSKFISLYGNLIPKQHFLIHFPSQILKFGSLMNYMCLRCEANHKYYKRLISVLTAYRNIPLFLARRDQLHQAYLWKKTMRHESTCGPHKSVRLEFAYYGNLVQAPGNELVESSWLDLNGVKFKPEHCYVVVGLKDYLPVFAFVKTIIVHPQVAFVCQDVKTVGRNLHAGCFIVPLTNGISVHRPEDMLVHSVFHAHSFGNYSAIVSKSCLGGQP